MEKGLYFRRMDMRASSNGPQGEHAALGVPFFFLCVPHLLFLSHLQRGATKEGGEPPGPSSQRVAERPIGRGAAAK